MMKYRLLHITRDLMKSLYKKVLDDYFARKEKLQKKGILALFVNTRGYVLILVILITTLLMSLSANFITIAMTNRFYMEKMGNRFRASLIARSGIELGKYILNEDMKNKFSTPLLKVITGKKSVKNTDSYHDLWALHYPDIPLPLISEENLTESEKAQVTEKKDTQLLEFESLVLRIEDENAKINLSAFSNEKLSESDQPSPYYGIAYRFFLNMEMQEFADIILDWVDTNDNKYPYGAESFDYYQSLPSSYMAKNDGMDSIDELLMVKDMTPEIYYGMGGGNMELELEKDLEEKKMVEHNKGDLELSANMLDALSDNSLEELKEKEKEEIEIDIPIGKEKSRKLSDYFTVYGYRNEYYDRRNKININTASYRVLSALTDNMDDDIVTTIIQKRLKEPFKTINETEDFITDKTIRDNAVSVQSYIFKIVATGIYKETEVKITVYYDRYSRKIVYWSED